MPDRSIRRAFWQGARDSLPFLIVVVPFGMIFGVLASEAGWTLAQILGMSVLVIAGASQFTALQLLSEQAPLLIVDRHRAGGEPQDGDVFGVDRALHRRRVGPGSGRWPPTS